MSYKAAYTAFWLLNLVLLGFVWKWIRPDIEMIAFAPLWVILVTGQDSILLLFVLAASLMCIRHNRMFVAGLVLGCGMFRFQHLLPIVVLFVAWREWRLITGFILSALGTVALSASLTDLRSYVAILRLTIAHPELYAPIERMPDLRGLLHALHQTELLLAVGTLVMVVAFFRGRSQSNEQRMALAIWTVAIVSFHFFIHDMVILAIPMSAVRSDRTKLLMLSATAFALLNVDVYIVVIATIICAVLSERRSMTVPVQLDPAIANNRVIHKGAA